MTHLWTIGPGRVDSAQFFRLLPVHFRDATTLFAEGTSIEADVQSLFKASTDEGAYLPGAQTIWPKSLKFRCRFGAALCEQLALVAEHHAEPELLDHFFLYAGNDALLQWPDAFGQEMFLTLSLGEARVSNFANSLGLPYAMRKNG